MRARYVVPAVVGIILTLAASSGAQEPLTIIDKAITAHGGTEKMGRVNGTRSKSKGKISVMGVEILFEATAASILPDRLRNEMELDVAGQKVGVTQVYNGKEAWVQAQGQTMELKDKLLEEMREGLYGAYVESLVPLKENKDKQFTLAPLGEIKINDKPAVGMKVSAKGHRDIDLYFDKDSGLLIRSERRGLDSSTQMEVSIQQNYSDFFEVEGLKVPRKIAITNDGKPFMEAETVEVKLGEKIPDSEFAKP